jgi:polysaccharide export outer membrane protein
MTRVKTLTWMLANALCATSIAAQPVRPPSAQSEQNPGPALLERHPRYILQREDVLRLTFPLSPELDQTVTVEPDGYINLQNAGSVFAQGLTSPDLVLAVKKAYVGILHDPIVNVDVTNFQKPLFTVTGQVGKPGQFELRAETTLAEGLAVAGGMAANAKGQVFLLRKTPANGYEVRRVNVGAMLTGKNIDEVPVLKPGDIVYVPERFITSFRRYIPYTFNLGTYANSAPF